MKLSFKILIKKLLHKSIVPLIKTLSEEDMRHLNTNLVQIRNLDYLYEAMLWKNRPDFNREKYLGCDDPMNVNGRRILDMEVVLGACKNMEDPSGTILEIGTAYGNMTMNMSKNAPNADIYTINIPEEEIDEGGTHVTFSIPNDSIGAAYKNANCKNITQILANTLHWQPEMERIDVAFIDGSHDADFIYQDTVKVLSKCKPGSIILWHDFNPDLVDKWGWIKDVCSGVNRLYSDGHLSKRMYHVQDSWVGIYIV